MTDSINLVTAQISLLDPQLTIIHIPLQLYSLYAQPILSLLFGENHDEDASKIPWTNRHEFLNVCITPVECSVICTRRLAERFFRPIADLLQGVQLNNTSRNQIQFSTDDYIAIQVDGQGLDAGQRVLELTSPLAMAGISIFFITTYFSDYILVPSNSRRTVTKALEQRGFVFSQTADAFVSQLSPSSPTTPFMGPTSSYTGLEFGAPSTPPARDIHELQSRTFTKLKRNAITPVVDESIRLVNCAGTRESSPSQDKQLKNDLLQVLLATYPFKPEGIKRLTTTVTSAGLGLTAAIDTEVDETIPDFTAKFLSITITATEPISILLEHRLLDRLGESIVGEKSEDDILIPISLDLRDLPMEAPGIVCGVAGRLSQGIGSVQNDPSVAVEQPSSIDLSFLSTARAGTVIVKASQLRIAVEAFEFGMKQVTESEQGMQNEE